MAALRYRQGMNAARRRIDAIDLARGVAILAMAAFHFAWDAYFYGYYLVDVTQSPPWIAFQKAILSSFLLLAGSSLVLGHGSFIRWRPFWRRFSLIALAALATTAGTYVMFPDYFVYFGVLHAIALFSLMGLALLRLPLWLLPPLAAAVLLPPLIWTSEIMRERALAWIGFWPVSPPTTDIVPIFPWFAVTILGIFAMRLLLRTRVWEVIAAWQAPPALRWLAFAGRWSLLLYLLHQPLLIAGFELAVRIDPPLPFVPL